MLVAHPIERGNLSSPYQRLSDSILVVAIVYLNITSVLRYLSDDGPEKYLGCGSGIMKSLPPTMERGIVDSVGVGVQPLYYYVSSMMSKPSWQC